MIYFKIPQGNPGKIKIGYSGDYRGGTKRTKELQTGCPDKLVDWCEPLWGHTKQMEHDIHKILKKWNIHGDWFRLTKESSKIIRQLRDEIRQADMSLPLFAYSQRVDTKIFQLEEKLGAAVSKSQELEKQAYAALAEARKYRTLYTAARFRLNHPGVAGLAGFLADTTLGIYKPNNTLIAKFDPHAKPVNLQELIEKIRPQ